MANGDIKITIIGSGDGSGSGESGGGRKKKEKTAADMMLDTIRKLMHPVQTAKATAEESAINVLGGSGKAEMVVGLSAKIVADVAQEAYSIAIMEHNRYFTLREDYIGQNKMNAIQTQIGTAKSLLSSIVGGAIAGGAIGVSSANPLGVAVGAVVGGVTSGVKAGLNLRVQRDQKIEQYNMQLNATNAQTRFMASRASLVNGGRGTEY